MEKFLKAFDKVFEQDETDINVQSEVEPQVEIPTQPEVQPLSPESEVLLIRLMRKALVTEISPEDVDSLSEMGDINEKNAKEGLTTLINIMKKYSSDIEVET